jgi:hypothetical protein
VRDALEGPLSTPLAETRRRQRAQRSELRRLLEREAEGES